MRCSLPARAGFPLCISASNQMQAHPPTRLAPVMDRHPAQTVVTTQLPGETWPLLVRAVWTKQWDDVSRLLDSGTDINAVDADGCTALLRAAWLGEFEVVKELISRGADLNVVSKHGETALSKALSKGFIRIAQLLLIAKAEVHAGRIRGNALMCAIKMQNPAFLDQIIARGADVITPIAGVSPFVEVIAAPIETFVCMATSMLAAGVRVNAKMNNPANDTPLIAAVKKGPGHIEHVRWLLQAGARINKQNASGCTALMAAVEVPHNIAVVSLLIQAGANVSIQDNKGSSPMLEALKRAAYDVLDVLVAAGGTLKGGPSELLLDYALVKVLSSANRKAAHTLVAAGADVERVVQVGTVSMTPLIRASAIGNPRVVKGLLELGANPNGPSHLKDLTPALVTCCLNETRWHQVLPLLINAGADVNAASAVYGTALHVAARACSIPMAKALLAAGARVDTQDGALWDTPILNVAILECAKAPHQKQMIELLIRAGADVDAERKTHHTHPSPLHCAIQAGKAGICVMLLRAGATTAHPNAQLLRAAAMIRPAVCLDTILATGAVAAAEPRRLQQLLDDLLAEETGCTEAGKLLSAGARWRYTPGMFLPTPSWRLLLNHSCVPPGAGALNANLLEAHRKYNRYDLACVRTATFVRRSAALAAWQAAWVSRPERYSSADDMYKSFAI